MAEETGNGHRRVETPISFLKLTEEHRQRAEACTTSRERLLCFTDVIAELDVVEGERQTDVEIADVIVEWDKVKVSLDNLLDVYYKLFGKTLEFDHSAVQTRLEDTADENGTLSLLDIIIIFHPLRKDLEDDASNGVR